MRIGCLQFAPQVGDVNHNLNRADSVLSRANLEDLDILVLPELAFSGYNFKSLRDIAPFLEPSGAGITSLWARTTALKYDCIVAAGYPEKVDVSHKWPTSPEYYNSLIVVNEEGETIANYRKTHLYYTDEKWALEGPQGFYKGHIPGLGHVAMGICMDINPWRFETPWETFEFASHVLHVSANLVVLSMAWLTHEDARDFSRTPKEPDMDTLTYWVKRLEPLIRSENDDEIIVIFANRTGVEDEVVYAGTSAVVGVRRGEVSVYGILGRGEKELLVVDTSLPPFAKLLYRPDGEDISIETGDGARVSPAPREAIGANVSSFDDNNASRTSNSPPTISEPHPDNSLEGKRKVFGGHVFVTSDALTPYTAHFPTTPFEESPLSPRYFWTPAEYTNTESYDYSSTSSIRSDHNDSTQSNLSVALQHQSASRNLVPDPREDTKNLAQVLTPRKSDAELPRKFAELVEALPASSGHGNCPARTSSPKSRNASRTGREDRSNYVLAQRRPSAFGSIEKSNVIPSNSNMPNSATWKPRSTSRNQVRPPDLDLRGASAAAPRKSRSASIPQRPQTEVGLMSDLQRHHSASPDLDKIGADLMVFEEGPRPRRDSLECHPDEDDFVLVHASQVRGGHTRGRTGNGESTERSMSKTSGTPTRTDSPALGYNSSSYDTIPALRSSQLVGARAVSRGRQPTSRHLPSKDSPRTLEHTSSMTASHLTSSGTEKELLNLADSPAANTSRRRLTNDAAAKASPKAVLHHPQGLSSSQISRKYPDDTCKEHSSSPFRSPEASPPVQFRSKAGHSPTRRMSSRELPQPTTTSTANPSIAARIRTRREPPRGLEMMPSIYSSTVTTIEIVETRTPKDAPQTPKAMTLAPGWDRGIQDTTVNSGTAPENGVLECIDTMLRPTSDRPKSVVW